MTSEEVAALFHEQVVASYYDFVEQTASGPFGNSQDLRAGLLAAIALYHFREHLTGSLALSTDEVMSRCPEYSLVRDVADIAKHRTLDRPSAKLRGPDAIHETILVTQYRDELGDYRHSEKSVELKLPDGSVRSLAEVLANAVAFWREHLVSNDIPILEFDLKIARSREPRPRAKCAEVPVSVIRGLRFTMSYKIQRYNYDTGQLEPVDLSGKELQYRIFEPKYKIDVVLKHPQTGDESTRNVILNPDQAEAFDKLDSAEARQKFLAETWQVRDAVARLVAAAGRDEAGVDTLGDVD
jgi:hypothetical protein